MVCARATHRLALNGPPLNYVAWRNVASGDLAIWEVRTGAVLNIGVIASAVVSPGLPLAWQIP